MTHARRHYPNAPILEAVIDIKVNIPNVGFAEFPFQSEIVQSSEYPHCDQIYSFAGNVQINRADAQVHTTGEAKPLGWKLTSVDKRRIVQHRIDGMSFSVLAPYGEWESFRAEARSMWSIYRSIRRPDYVTRVAVRYINQLALPCTFERLHEYLALYPDIPKEMSQRHMSHFFMQFMLPQDDLGCMLIINQTPTKSRSPQQTNILLDLDVYKDSIEETDDSVVWEVLEMLHSREYHVFESCITNKTRELIC